MAQSGCPIGNQKRKKQLECQVVQVHAGFASEPIQPGYRAFKLVLQFLSDRLSHKKRNRRVWEWKSDVRARTYRCCRVANILRVELVLLFACRANMVVVNTYTC